MDMESCVPPGFRFHPTEEELVGYYLKRKINSLKIDLDVIVEIDLYKMEPWDIQDKCKLGYEEQNEWYFFSHKDKKYPTGTRTNRATAAGFWKATGRDKAVMSKNRIIGMRKTLVFYKGRAPNGRKTDWIMHEYRHQTSEHGPPQEEGWVVCRAFRKPSPSHHQRQLGFDPWCSSNQAHYFRDQSSSYGGDHGRPLSITDILTSQTHHHLHHHLMNNHPTEGTNFSHSFGSDHHHQQQEQFLISNNNNHHQQLIELPQLDSPTSIALKESSPINNNNEEYCSDERNNNNNGGGQQGIIDWKSLDNLFADTSSYFSNPNMSQFMTMIPQQQQPHNNHHHLGCFPDS
ncbi:hypothetical protein PIB30_063444 [Stylosanthes scabra]|uniref:NAC domain-containing protein n=1 Tax=Stylosanthes scabra TaxID=79078 RepID=A0ABU6YIY4_9FABA|nr:hypothetical protein [Stylosanthes scabra]